MVAFQNDYIAGAHPEILKKLTETNFESLPGYGSDHYCESAKEKIKVACGCPEAEVEFLVGGTQTNSIIVSTMIQEYEGVVAATTGHVNVHESGAIEYSGHKVLTVPQKNGKIEAASLRHFLETFYADGTQEHMVYPGMVYISHPTEYGTLYTKMELEEGYGLMSYDTDVTLQDIARISDVFYIGGTKVGALCGEAVVFTKGNKPAHFENRIKKRGALLAKGRLLGIQFDTLFTDDLYFKISRHAIDMAEKMKAIVREKGYEFFINSPTNQQFVILKNSDMERIAENVVFSVWEPVDEDHTAVRFATSWATTEEDLAALKEAL